MAPALTVPFSHHGAGGHVLIDYGPGVNVDEIGFADVAVGYDPTRFTGFPVFEAHLTYDGTGYRRLFGWLQLITRTGADGQPGPVSVDTIPALADLDFPLATYGYLPSWYDAPANPDDPDGTWTADTFLVAVPARERVVSMITGIRWGYHLRNGRPTLLALDRVDRSTWDDHLGPLAAQYPSWGFV